MITAKQIQLRLEAIHKQLVKVEEMTHALLAHTDGELGQATDAGALAGKARWPLRYVGDLAKVSQGIIFDI